MESEGKENWIPNQSPVFESPFLPSQTRLSEEASGKCGCLLPSSMRQAQWYLPALFSPLTKCPTFAAEQSVSQEAMQYSVHI